MTAYLNNFLSFMEEIMNKKISKKYATPQMHLRWLKKKNKEVKITVEIVFLVRNRTVQNESKEGKSFFL